MFHLTRYYFSATVSDSEPIQAVKGVKVVDIGVNSFTLSWRKTPGASGYKISWIPFLGEITYIVSHVCIHPNTHTHACKYAHMYLFLTDFWAKE